jgi:hypothetical protein
MMVDAMRYAMRCDVLIRKEHLGKHENGRKSGKQIARIARTRSIVKRGKEQKIYAVDCEARKKIIDKKEKKEKVVRKRGQREHGRHHVSLLSGGKKK